MCLSLRSDKSQGPVLTHKHVGNFPNGTTHHWWETTGGDSEERTYHMHGSRTTTVTYMLRDIYINLEAWTIDNDD